MMRSSYPVLDPRLSLVYDLYTPCELAADIGTDHAHLPAALLQRGRCQRMILTDISPDALNNARQNIIREKLTDRVDFRLGFGLDPLSEACRVISVTGMGGRTIREILLSGQDRLRSAALILSAHTDWHLIRQTVMEIGYHITAEEPCVSGGRFYLVLRAEPGEQSLSGRQLRLGGPLFHSSSPALLPFLSRRRRILSVRLQGLMDASCPDAEMIRLLQDDIAYLDSFISKKEIDP